MGEVDGLHVDGFDYGNSPAQFGGINLSGIPLIQRTTSGTQGVVRSRGADTLMITGFCTAGATAGFIESLSPMEVSFVITGKRAGGCGDEDQACADYIESLLLEERVDPEPFLERVKRSIPGRYFLDQDLPQYPLKDLDYCLKIDRFDFVMLVKRTNGDLRMQSSKL